MPPQILQLTKVTFPRSAAGKDEFREGPEWVKIPLSSIVCFPRNRAIPKKQVGKLARVVAGVVSVKDLFNVAAAASYNGKVAWITQTAKKDLASPSVWRQRRGTELAGLGVGYTLPVAEAWPEGELCTENANLRHKASRRR